MIKKLKSTLIINAIGLLALFLCFFGYQGFMSFSHSPSHQSVVIDEGALKEQLNECPTLKLQTMLSAGIEIKEWVALLEQTGTHIIEKVLVGHEVFSRKEHYPLQDTFDRNSYSQYYYHAHRGGEHGHFHLFLRQGGMEKGMVPILYDVRNKALDDTNTFAHLIAISMDDEGYPLTLFTTNRWVTGEDWYSSADLKKMIKRFNVNHTHPSYIVNRWLKAMLTLFEPQIFSLIDGRDKRLMNYRSGVPLKMILEDQELDVLTEEKISIDCQIKLIKEILKERKEE